MSNSNDEENSDSGSSDTPLVIVSTVRAYAAVTENHACKMNGFDLFSNILELN